LFVSIYNISPLFLPSARKLTCIHAGLASVPCSLISWSKTKLSFIILKSFKKFEEETFLFNNFDLIVGANNTGKSTVLQALAIWQFCVEQFRNARKKGTNGIQIVLPNFTALPVPEFNLLWKDKTDRKYEQSSQNRGKNQIYIYIEIDVYWKNSENEVKNFCVQLRYQSPQALFARPLNGWSEFNEIDNTGEMQGQRILIFD